MKTLKRTAAAAGFAAMILLGACSTTDSTKTANDDYGRVDPAATTGSVEGTSTTPAVIPGPAKVVVTETVVETPMISSTQETTPTRVRMSKD
jgi:ABC-type enterochelin transport system substrate-binding protein